MKVMIQKGRRPKFADVVDVLWEQMDDLGGDLHNALLIPPRGATLRQVNLALRRIQEAE